jgi:hypothetical protein
MLPLDDSRWGNLNGGYRMKCDPRPLLAKLENGKNKEATWDELWKALHHQGDVGEASYAAVPHLVRIYRSHDKPDWNTYAIVAIIELARERGTNPSVPKWLEDGYFSAIQELAQIGAAEVLTADNPEAFRAILAIIAIAKGIRTYGRFLVEFSEDELLEMESKAGYGCQ